MSWRHPTVIATAPSFDDDAAWTRLARALREAADVGYRAVRLRSPAYDARVVAILDPLGRRGIHTQLALDPDAIRSVTTAAAPVSDTLGTWLVETPAAGESDDVIAVVDDAIEALANHSLRRGLCVPLTKTRARDIEALVTVAADGGCALLVVTADGTEVDPADELERSMAYVASRRAGRDTRSLDVDIDLFEREHVARIFAPSLSTSAPLTRLVPTLVIAADGQVDPVRSGIPGYSIGRLGDAPLLQLLARWRTGKATRWVALHRNAIARVGRREAWPIIDWPTELVACARVASAEHGGARGPAARQ